MAPPPADPDDRSEALRRPLADALAASDLEVTELRRLSGGASRETWAVGATGPDGERPLILQRLRPGGAAGGPSMAIEDRLLTAARAAGVPVPPVMVDVADCEAAGLGEARISERVAGEALGPRIVRAERSADARRGLARQMGAALAAVHALDPDAVPGLEVVDALGRVRDGLDLLGEARPALELGLRHLEATRPPAGPDAVVHGDFRVGNLLIEGDRLTAVLDWELAHRGDPTEDLGWLCGRAWRFGGDHEVGGVADLEDLLAGYVEAGGRPTTPEAVRWWTAAGTLLWGLICAVQARRHLDGFVRSVELATIGRRVCEAEYDLLGLVLETPLTSSAAAASGPHGPQDALGPDLYGRPTAAELVDAVRGHLSDEVAPGLDGSARFHTRVAVHALELVERELRLGPTLALAHARRLDDLGVADDRELATRIRAGELDGRADVEAAVRSAVVDRLRIANPGWLHDPDR